MTNWFSAGRSGRVSVWVLAVLMVQGVLTSAGSAAPQESQRSTGPAAVACERPARGFVPTRASIPAIGRTVRVIQVRRTSRNQVGAGPVTEAGKWLMAMDPHNRPASRRGSVLLSAHTWPDGSALGNALLRNLHEGEGVVMRRKNGVRACYRVTKRTSYPAKKVPRSALRSTGPERLVIVACSGKRLGPGKWTRRTLWYASPMLPAPTPPSAPPPAEEPDGGGLGGLLGGLLGGG